MEENIVFENRSCNSCDCIDGFLIEEDTNREYCPTCGAYQ